MTPALLFALEQEYMIDVGLLTFPVDKLTWLYANSNRDRGEQDKDGRTIRQPAPVMDLDEFRTYGRKLKSLAAKVDDDGWDPSLMGTRTNIMSMKAWADVRSGMEFVPHKEQ